MAQHGARILVADNDCGMRQIISYVVRGLSHEAVVVSDGIEAIEALRTDRPFALLIVDIVMPRLSGRSLIRQLAAEKRAERIIVVSGSCSSENMVELARLGVIEFVRKPFGREELELAIVNALAATPSDAANGSTVEDVANDEPLEEAVETLVKDACAGHVALPSASKSFARILSMHADPELARESVFELIRASVAIESHVFAQANGATYGEQEPTADIDV
ncbi:MAG: DNA-binding NtrC family response regulator, partial [Myxococcota bacterium]